MTFNEATLGQGEPIFQFLGVVLPLAREGKSAQADKKTVGWKEMLAMERRGSYNEKKGAWLVCFAPIVVRIAEHFAFVRIAERRYPLQAQRYYKKRKRQVFKKVKTQTKVLQKFQPAAVI